MFWLMYFLFGPLLILAAMIVADAERGYLAEASSGQTAELGNGMRALLILGAAVTFVGLLFSFGGTHH